MFAERPEDKPENNRIKTSGNEGLTLSQQFEIVTHRPLLEKLSKQELVTACLESMKLYYRHKNTTDLMLHKKIKEGGI